MKKMRGWAHDAGKKSGPPAGQGIRDPGGDGPGRGGGSGAGVTLQPLGFLVVKDGDVKLLQLATSSNTADKIVNSVPDIIDKVSDAFSKNKDDKSGKNGKKSAGDAEKASEKAE